FLIAGWKKISDFKNLLNISSRFSTDRLARPFIRTFLELNLSTLLMCCIAFLAGLQISLFNQNLFNPMSVVINLAATPFLWLIFLISFIALLCPCEIISCVFDSVIFVFRIVITSFSGPAIRLASPPFTAFLFTFSLPLFVLIFTKPGKKLCLICAVAIFASISFCFFIPVLRGSKTYAISGGGRPPAIVALRPDTDSAYVINVPGKEHSQKIIELLSSNGFSAIDKVYCSESLISFSEGAPQLFSYFDCGSLIFLSNPSISPYAKIASQSAGKNLVKVKIQANTKIKRSDGSPHHGYEFKISLSQDDNIKISRLKDGSTLIENMDEDKKFSSFLKNRLNLKLTNIGD
ncbi:MAG TPA: hypothetical protein PK821_07065, partial [Victivallales bacterium]|nr:hypothetical protein [Victivallales bacterium]